MKRLGAALLVAVLAACSETTLHEPRAAELDVEALAKIKELGFRSDMVVDGGDHYLVEGDIMIDKSWLEAWRRADLYQSSSQQWQTPGVVSQSVVSNIVVNLSGIAAYPDWLAATRQAMAEYGALSGTTIRFVEGSNAHINVSMYSTHSSTGATASWPVNGSPGPTIQINSQANVTSHDLRVHIMAHEFGHTVGFRHSNWQTNSEGQNGAILIPNTPSNDAQSIMQSVARPWTGFSGYDYLSLQYLYPSRITALSVSNQASAPYLTWTAPDRGPATYHINLVVEYQQYNEVTGESSSSIQSTEGVASFLSATSYHDTQRPWTGETFCPGQYNTWQWSEFYHYRYEVTAIFPNGGASVVERIGAPVAPC